MSAGTLTLTNNSARVSGNGTSFSTELAAGDFIVMKTGGVTYTLPVKTVESDSALTLSRPYAGPAVSGSAWTAMPRDTLNSISAQIATDTAYAIRQRVLEIDNWYQLLEVNGDITIKMADGSTYTGPSWLRIIDIMKTMKIEDLMPLADQIHTDAAQVAADKPVIIQAKADAEAAAAAALASETASSGYAASADSAKTAAEVAQGKAEKAAQDAASHNPVASLAKENNLSDLEDRVEAWLNVRPTGPTPLAANPLDEKDAATKGWVESVRSVLASWSVINNVTPAPANNTTVYGGDIRSEYQVAGSNIASLAQRSGMLTGSHVFYEFILRESQKPDKVWSFNRAGDDAFRMPGAVVSSVTSLGASNAFGSSFMKSAAGYNTASNQNGFLYCEGPDNNTYYRSDMYQAVNAYWAYRNFIANGSTVREWDYRNDGNAYALNGTWVNGASDIRVKTDFKPIENPFDTMHKIRAGTWRMATEGDEGRYGIGVLANGLYDDYPEAAINSGPHTLASGEVVEDVLTVQAGDSGVLAAVHHAAILELMQEVEALKAEVAALKTAK